MLTELKQEETQETINNEVTECCYCLTQNKCLFRKTNAPIRTDLWTQRPKCLFVRKQESWENGCRVEMRIAMIAQDLKENEVYVMRLPKSLWHRLWRDLKTLCQSWKTGISAASAALPSPFSYWTTFFRPMLHVFFLSPFPTANPPKSLDEDRSFPQQWELYSLLSHTLHNKQWDVYITAREQHTNLMLAFP